MLRLAHISDTHLGNRQYGSDTRKQDYLDAFEESIDKCIDYNVTAVIHTGDLFDDPNPDVDTLDETVRIFKKLEDAGIPVYGIVGNHERKRTGQWMDLIGQLSNTNRLDRTPTIIEDDGESVVLYGFDAIRKNQWSTTDFSLAPPKAEYSDAPRIVCFHELFTPPLDAITADYDLEPILEKLEVTPNLVALGDNHQPEETTLTVDETEVTAYYPGSTEKTSRADPETHSFMALAIENGEITTRQPVQLENTRDFITTTIEFKNESDGAEVVREKLGRTDFSTPPDEKDSVAIVKLTGHNTGVTHNDIRREMREKPTALVKIVDERQSTEFSTEDYDLSEATTDIQSAVSDAVANVEVSDSVAEIETIVRDTNDVPDSHIRDKVENILTDGDTQ